MTHRRGMTLIEVLVVVAIMAIVAGAIAPFAISRAHRKLSATSYGGAAAAVTDEAPPMERAVVRVSLDPIEHASGLSQYRARFDGRFTFDAREDDESSLWFPFPNTAEATDVTLTLDGEETSGAEFTPRGVGYRGHLPPGAEVRVTYSAMGSGRFDFGLSGTRRIAQLDVEATGPGLSPRLVADDALRPSGAEPSRLRWRYENLVTERGITLELPRSLSPLGRTLLMCKLAALGVLIFGVGFWYFGELDAPGRLDTFRWGHFLLLAFTLSLFFIAFAVFGLSAEMSVGPGLAVSAALSLPLLVLHVSRIFDLRFAILRALPLAIYALGMVVIGVFGGEDRPAVFVGAAVVGVASLIWTYRRWLTGRRAHRRRRQRDAQRSVRDGELSRQIDALQHAVNDARTFELDAATDYDPDLAPLVVEVAHRVDELASRRRHAEERLAAARDADELDDAEHEAACAAWTVELPALTRSLEAACERLADSTAHLQRRQELLHQRRREVPLPHRHCMACGDKADSGNYCAGCGVRLAHELSCGSCQQPTHLPTHVIVGDWEARALHCDGCGDQLVSP